MKTLSLKILFFVVFLMPGLLLADDFSEALLETKGELAAAMNQANEKELLKIRAKFERILQLKQDQWLVNYYIALTDYNLAINSMMGQGGNAENLKKYTQAGLENIDKSILLKDDFADAYVLKLALNFNRWQYEPEKIEELIAATEQAKGEAKGTDPDNPRLLLFEGISSYYTPEAFGGGANTAISQLEKSISLFGSVKPANVMYPDWGEDWAYGYMILSYIKRNNDGDMSNAKNFLDKARGKFPESGFVNGYVMGEWKKVSEVN